MCSGFSQAAVPILALARLKLPRLVNHPLPLLEPPRGPLIPHHSHASLHECLAVGTVILREFVLPA